MPRSWSVEVWMKARINGRKEEFQKEEFLKEEVFQALLKLQLAELGYSVGQDALAYESYEVLFAYLLKTVRHLRGWSQAELAKRSDVREATISRLERGAHRPQERTIVDLSRALDVSPEYLQPERVFSEWHDYPAAALKRLSELPEAEEWGGDPAAARERLSALRARDIQAARRAKRAAIEQEKTEE
jgi:transcriptional regulator with XRE-family HTH domain